MHDILKRGLMGALFSFQIAMGARLRKSLTASGIVGAMVIGTTCYACGGPVFYRKLIGFFIAGSLITGYRKKEKERRNVWNDGVRTGYFV